MKRFDKKYILGAIVIIVILTVIFVIQKSFAIDLDSNNTSSLEIKYNEYEALPKNYVHIKSLALAKAQFSSTSNSFLIKDNANNQLSNDYASRVSDYKKIFYHGPVNYGTSNVTYSNNANMRENNVNGSFTLLFKKAAVLSDNSTADVKMVVSNIRFFLGKNEGNITGDVYLPLMDGDNNTLWAILVDPNSSIKSENVSTSTKADVKLDMKIDFSIVDSDTGNPINSKYEQMLFGLYDLDCSDTSIDWSKPLADTYNGDYAEGVELISGFFSPVVLGPRTSDNKSMNNLLQVKNLSNGNIKLQGDGNLYQAKKDYVGTTNDAATYYSGFVAPVKPQGFSFRWYGSTSSYSAAMGTVLYGFPNVKVTATSGEGGTIEKPGVEVYNLNSSTTYDYTPAHGYRVKSLKVNGEDVGFSKEGGTYTFRKLYKSPLVVVNDDNSIGAPLGEDYTIDVRFEEADKIKVKYATDKYGSIDKTEENVIEKDSPLGVVDTPNTGYKLLSIKCNKPVTLSTGKIISKDNPMTLEELKKIIVEQPLVCTVTHKKDNPKTYNCD